MSTSLLYHGCGIVGYKYLRTQYQKGMIVFGIDQSRSSLRCPICGNRKVKRRGRVLRRFRSLPMGKKPIYIEFAVPRIECSKCNVVRQVKISFAHTQRTYTKRFERFVVDLSRHMTILDVARHLKTSWDLVKDIQKRYLTKRFKSLRLKGLQQIAIDEISIGKGHNYLTVVLDLMSGAVVFIGNGKGSDSLEPFWKKVRSSGANIKAVAIDMSPAYISAVLENLPNAAIVFDRFHVMKMYNDKLSDLRRYLQQEAEDPLQLQVIKGTRWLLLKNKENLNQEADEKERLQRALKLNKPLATAYYLKDELRLLWQQENKAAASRLLASWAKTARSTNIKILMKMANSLQAHRSGLLNWYDFPISTGPLEGTNNKIRTLQRQAYGFRDKEFFKLKIFGLHETKYALIG